MTNTQGTPTSDCVAMGTVAIAGSLHGMSISLRNLAAACEDCAIAISRLVEADQELKRKMELSR